MSEQLKAFKETLISKVMSANLDECNAKELGEVVDMIKDIEEAEYYCSIVKAMEDSKKNSEDQEKINAAIRASETERNYYGGRVNYPDRMGYYDPNIHGTYRWYGGEVPGNTDGRDMRRSGYDNPSSDRMSYYSGKSPMIRRGYMEAKENHMDKAYQTHELETYVQELGSDITEMIRDASPDDKKMLKEKLTALANKIS